MTDALGGDDDDDGACIIEHSLQPQYCSNHGLNLHSHPDPVIMFHFPLIHWSSFGDTVVLKVCGHSGYS